MRYYSSLVGLASLSVAASQFVISAGSTISFSSGSPEAVAYFLDNNPNGSNIFALPINAGGSLGLPVKTSTGGKGSIYVNATTNAPVQADPLGAQGSVSRFGDMLFTVNAGSNTLSMFSVNPKDPLNPVLVGSPASTLGEFPISVDYSPKLGKACVLNSGAKAGVACFTVNPYTGLVSDGILHTLPKSVINETTPPTGPPGTASQLLFNPDSTALLATFKGTGSTSTTQGSVVAWPVGSGNVSVGSPVINRVSELITPFGFSFIDSNHALVADVSSGGSVVRIASNLTISSVQHTTIANQSAICWTLFVPSLNAGYLIDAGSEDFYAVNPQTGEFLTDLRVRTWAGASLGGTFDSAYYKGNMYSLVGTNGVAVFDLAAGKLASYLDLSAVGDRQYYTGMAIWS